MPERPRSGEFAPFFQAYIDRVPDGDVIETLERQGEATAAWFARIDEATGSVAYAPGKWTVRRVLQHITDGERVFAYRSLCVARGEELSLPGFDEDRYAANDGSEDRRLHDIAAEFAVVRAATLALFRGFDGAAWARRGTANGQPLAVRAVPWIIAGHELHHLAVLRDRYRVVDADGRRRQ